LAGAQQAGAHGTGTLAAAEGENPKRHEFMAIDKTPC
jgi:hypothetical protein